MPTIKFHSVKTESILNAGIEFQQALADAYETSLDNISLEVVHSTFISMGKEESPVYPRVEVHSFKRSKEVEAAAAACIHNMLIKQGYPANNDIYHIYLEEDGYYVDGEKI